MAQLDEVLTGTQVSDPVVIPGYYKDVRALLTIQGVWAGVVTPEISVDGGATWSPLAGFTSNPIPTALELKGGVRIRLSAVLTSGSAHVQVAI